MCPDSKADPEELSSRAVRILSVAAGLGTGAAPLVEEARLLRQGPLVQVSEAEDRASHEPALVRSHPCPA